MSAFPVEESERGHCGVKIMQHGLLCNDHHELMGQTLMEAAPSSDHHPAGRCTCAADQSALKLTAHPLHPQSAGYSRVSLGRCR